MKICIDPGHGGRDPGAVVRTYGNGGWLTGPRRELVSESSLNLDISILLSWRLRTTYEAKVYQTRTICTSRRLPARVRHAEKHGADCFLSIHCNAAANPDVQGFEVFSFPGSALGWKLSSSIVQKVKQEFYLSGRAEGQFLPKIRGCKEANFYVLRKTTMPAVLIECGFMTHPRELRALFSDAYISKLTSAIAAGVCNWGKFLEASECSYRAK